MQAMGDRWEEGEGRGLEIKGAPMKAGEGACRHGVERSTGTVVPRRDAVDAEIKKAAIEAEKGGRQAQ